MLQTKSVVKMKSHKNKIAPSENISANFVQYRKKEKECRRRKLFSWESDQMLDLWPLWVRNSWKICRRIEKRGQAEQNRTRQNRAGWVSQVGGIFFWGATQSDRVGSGRDDSLVASNGQWGIFSFAEPANYRTRTYLAGMYYIMGLESIQSSIWIEF